MNDKIDRWRIEYIIRACSKLQVIFNVGKYRINENTILYLYVKFYQSTRTCIITNNIAPVSYWLTNSDRIFSSTLLLNSTKSNSGNVCTADKSSRVGKLYMCITFFFMLVHSWPLSRLKLDGSWGGNYRKSFTLDYTRLSDYIDDKNDFEWN